MFGLSIIDLLIIALYFAAIIWIGVWASRRIKNQEDYLLGGRKFGKIIQTFASFGQATSADGPVGTVTTTFKNGAAGIWSSLLMVFSTPLFWITSPWLRRMRVFTLGDFFEERYGSKKMAATYAIIGAIGMMGLLSVGYIAMTKTIEAITPKIITELTVNEKAEYTKAMYLSELETKDFNTLTEKEITELKQLRIEKPRSVFSHLNTSLIVWTVCLVIIIYAVFGGLEAAYYTDILQGVFIIILSLILLPFAWAKIKLLHAVGSEESAMSILHQKLPQSFFEIFGSPTVIDFTWYFIIASSLIAGITVIVQPNQLVTNAAAKDEYSARFGTVTGGFIKRFCTIMWGMVGLAAVLLYAGKVDNPDLVWGYAIHDLLGPMKLGLVGFMIASMMAALMSTAASLMLTVSGLLLHNVYRPLFPKKTEKHYVHAGRILGASFLIGGAIISTQFDSILEVLKFIWEFFIIFAGAFWLGLKWRRANKKGAWASIIATLLIFYILPVSLTNLIPNLKTDERMMVVTEPSPIERNYIAREADVTSRNEEIAMWNNLPDELKFDKSPQALSLGEKFTKVFVLPSKAIFWSQQPKINKSGNIEANGYFYPELIFYQSIGFDLTKIPYALNETIRMMTRLVFPFLVLILISLLTKPDNDEQTHKFFLKMRTKVRGLGNEIDQEDLEKAYANPLKTKEILLFPNSQFEIYKWNKQDFYGFGISIIIVFIVIGTLFFMVNLGNH